jgi:hypothetical protein
VGIPRNALWAVDIESLTGSPVATDVTFRSARFTWTLDEHDSASCEATLLPAEVSVWVPGQRRAVLRQRSDDARWWAGFLTHLTRSGPPADPRFAAAGLGLATALNYMVVGEDVQDYEDAADNIAWDRYTEATGGSYTGFTRGSTTGSPATRERSYCAGVGTIAEVFAELGDMDPGGFDWTVDPDGAINFYGGGRGSASGRSIAEGDTRDWSVEQDTTDLATVAVVDADCIPAPEVVTSGLSGTYGDRAVIVDSDTNKTADMNAKGNDELRARGAAKTELTASWLQERGPWSWGDVWLGDTVTAALDAVFGGSTAMRLKQVVLSLEPGKLQFVECLFEEAL